MKKLTRKLIDYLFYNFMFDILEENFRIMIILIDSEKGFRKEINMNYVPIAGSFIALDKGQFKVEKIIHATYGAVDHLEGKLL